MRSLFISAACMLLVAQSLCGDAIGATVSFDLGFTAPEQSMWGPGGGTLDFGVDGIIGSTGTVGIGYDIGASSGTVQGTFDGIFSIDYSESLYTPGSTTLSMNFSGANNGGIVSSLFGAWVDFDAWLLGSKVNLYDKGFQLAIDEIFTPELGATFIGSDSFTATGVGVDLWLAGASIDVDLQQNDTFVANKIDGTILYTNRDTGTNGTSEFWIGQDGTALLDLNLFESGTWDFSFLPFELDNIFSVDFDLEFWARAYYKSIDWGDHWYDFWKWHLDTNSWEYSLLDFDIYSANPFALDFEEDMGRNNVFSITVTEGGGAPVPEPGTMLLLGSGLAGLAGYARRRKK